jgi:two-component sensor histidine kinase
LALAFLPAGFVTVQAGLSALETRRGAIQGEQAVLALRSITVARDEITGLREMTRAVANSTDLLWEDLPSCAETASLLAQRLPPGSFVRVLDQRGVITCSSTPSRVTGGFSALLLIAEAERQLEPVLGFLPATAQSPHPALLVIAPTLSEGTEGRHYVLVGRDLRPILAASHAEFARPGAFVALMDRDGELLDSIGLDLAGKDAQALKAYVPSDAFGTAHQLYRLQAIGMPLEASGLALVEGWLDQPLGGLEALSIAWAFLSPFVLYGVAIGVTWFAIDRYATRPLLVLEEMAQSYASGEVPALKPERMRWSPVEVASLAQALHSMAGTLKGREARLTAALEEERALLLEVNHRVKNNLQLMASVLSILARDADNPADARGLNSARDRIQLLALAHVRIYDSNTIGIVDLDGLAADIARALVATHAQVGQDLRLELTLEPIRITSQQAIPFAFLIGESIAMILGRPEAGVRVLRMALHSGESGGFTLSIDADSTQAPTSSIVRSSERLIEAFCRQVGVISVRDPERPFGIIFDSRPASVTPVAARASG